MSFRVSTSQTFTQGTNAILDNQSKVSLTQLQLSKGTRILKPSDDPIGSSVALNLQRQIDNTTQYIANGQAAQARLATEDSVMDNVSSILGRVRELALLGANGTLNHSDREAICIEIEIGRAAGRGRGEISAVAVSLKKKKTAYEIWL